jgi:hypothetical protein
LTADARRALEGTIPIRQAPPIETSHSAFEPKPINSLDDRISQLRSEQDRRQLELDSLTRQQFPSRFDTGYAPQQSSNVFDSYGTQPNYAPNALPLDFGSYQS